MITKEELEEAIQGLDILWRDPRVRRNRFGDTLAAITVENVRGLNGTFPFHWPVTAIAGTNGSGKTTILQLASTAYTVVGSGARHYTIGRWIRSTFDQAREAPIADARSFIRYVFANDDAQIVVPYSAEQTRWRYPRRGNPERFSQFIGIGNYTPRIETVDRMHQLRSRLEVRASAALDARVLESISRILGSAYEQAQIHTVSVPDARWTEDIPVATRDGIGYAESNMGAGEQKLFRLIRILENLPNRSLILLEEPELMLHSDAQVGLAWYLISLARRSGHQIIVATHSEQIFEAMPPSGRLLLTRERGLTSVIPAAPRFSAARALSNSVRTNRDLVIVEDEAAARFLDSILQRYSAELGRNVTIVAVGSAREVLNVVGRLRASGVRAIGVRDPDVGDARTQGLFSLPGDQCVESLLLQPENVLRCEQFLAGIDVAVRMAQAHGIGRVGSDRDKRIFSAVSGQIGRDAEFVADRLTLAYLSDPGNGDSAQALTQDIRQALDLEIA